MIEETAKKLVTVLEQNYFEIPMILIQEYENEPPTLLIWTDNKKIREFVGNQFEGVPVKYDKDPGPIIPL